MTTQILFNGLLLFTTLTTLLVTGLLFTFALLVMPGLGQLEERAFLRGFQVIEADCAETALDLLKDEDLHIDVFVSDVVMPGLDGPSWVREAREARPDVPVVFMSGYAEDVFKSQGARIDASAFIAKPFSLTDLTSIVNQQLTHPTDTATQAPAE